MKNIAKTVVLISSLIGVLVGARAEISEKDLNREIRFDQRLNQVVSPETAFVDEVGRPVRLSDLFHNQPVVLTMGYYQCPMLCGVVLNALVRSLQEFSPESATRNFEFIFISVDPTETSKLALEKKRTYLRQYGWSPAEGRWHFLTGTQSSIQEVAKEIGFNFRYDAVSKQYVHPSGVVVLTPDRRISSYLLGVEFPARQLENSIQQARQKRIGSPVEQVLLLCFSGEPMRGTVGYVVTYALRIGAVATLLGLVLFIRSFSRPAAEKKSKT
jgi:protein SCO1